MERKVLVITGNVMEIGQALTNLFAANPKLKIITQFTSQSVREVQSSTLITVGKQVPGYEPITVIYLVYENPGDLQGLQIQQQDVKAKLTS